MPSRLWAQAVLPRIAVIAACVVILAWRVRNVNETSRLEVAPRVAQLMYMRLLSEHIDQYAATYRRPAYSMDSVLVHLDSEGRQTVQGLRMSIFGGLVDYAWDFCGFQLVVSTGLPRDTARPGRAGTPAPALFDPGRSGIVEAYSWPAGVGRDTRCREVN